MNFFGEGCLNKCSRMCRIRGLGGVVLVGECSGCCFRIGRMLVLEGVFCGGIDVGRNKEWV